MALGVGLCFLAAVFAIEAKLAWFSPAGTPPAQVSPSKMQPAGAPKLVAHALPAPVASESALAAAPLLVTLILLAPLTPFAFSTTKRHRMSIYASPAFSLLLRRPPPQSWFSFEQ